MLRAVAELKSANRSLERAMAALKVFDTAIKEHRRALGGERDCVCLACSVYKAMMVELIKDV